MMRALTVCISLVAALAVLGCATHPLAPYTRVSKDTTQRAEPAALALHSSKTDPDRPMNTRWRVDVLSVDGKPMGDAPAIVRIPSGPHTIGYECLLDYRFRDTAGLRSQGTIKASFEAGKTYYAYAREAMTASENNGANEVKSQENCAIDNFTEQNPNSQP